LLQHVDQATEQVGSEVDVDEDRLIVEQWDTFAQPRHCLFAGKWERDDVGLARNCEAGLNQRCLKVERVAQFRPRLPERGDTPIEQSAYLKGRHVENSRFQPPASAGAVEGDGKFGE
jgi:hypothetical protein